MSEHLWYLASPYRGHPDGVEQAFVDATKMAAKLLDMGFEVYSPIVHSHPLSFHVESAPQESDWWLDRQIPFMEASCGIIIGIIPGWDVSKGIAFERDFFKKAGKPERFAQWYDGRCLSIYQGA
jgi:hypothetical protein